MYTYEYELKASVKLFFFYECKLAPPRDGYPNSPFSNAVKLLKSDLHVTRQVPNYWLFQNIGWYLYWCKFLQVISCYLNYTCTFQLIRGVSHLDNSFIWWFRHHRVLFFVFWRLYSWRSQRSWRQGFRSCHNGWCTNILEALLNISLRSAHFIDESLWYKAKLTVTTLLYCWIIRISKLSDARLSELGFICQSSLNVSYRESRILYCSISWWK